MKEKVAVILSVYKSDNSDYLEKSIQSLLEQTYDELDIFIKVDGWVSDDIYQLLESLSCHNKIRVFFHDDNKGLATRLNELIDLVIDLGGYSYIARMDADDISCRKRIEVQVEFLNVNKDIDVVGSDVIEITDKGESVFYKKMDADHELMMQKIIKRCPFNHPSVMFRIDVFIQGFRYDSTLMNTQDYYLWVDLLSSGKKFANINQPLLYFRVNSSFHSRRGFNKAMNDMKSRIYAFKKLNVVNYSNLIHVFLLFFLRISPSFVKKLAYRFCR